jgi:hypothetical protein
MAVNLLPHTVTTENAGPYSGLLVSSFMVGRTLSSPIHLWAKICHDLQLVLVGLVQSFVGFVTILYHGFGLSLSFGIDKWIGGNSQDCCQ